MQLVIGQKNGNTNSIEIEDKETNFLNGKRIGDEFEGSAVGLEGYKLQITGGSDKEGFPMKKSLQGSSRRKVLVKGGIGVRELEKGARKRKSLRGNTVSEEIVQLNCKVVKKGSKSIEELLNSEDEEEEE